MCAGAIWTRGEEFVALNPNLQSSILSAFQSSFLIIDSRYGPNTCSHSIESAVTELIRYVTLPFWDLQGAASPPLQKLEKVPNK